MSLQEKYAQFISQQEKSFKAAGITPFIESTQDEEDMKHEHGAISWNHQDAMDSYNTGAAYEKADKRKEEIERHFKTKYGNLKTLRAGSDKTRSELNKLHRASYSSNKQKAEAGEKAFNEHPAAKHVLRHQAGD